MLAKRFFYVSAGLFLLALTYHLGARGAVAQTGGQVVGIAALFNSPGLEVQYLVTTSGGDVYRKSGSGSWTYIGNALGSGPTGASETSWGKVKADYRK